MQRDLVVTDPAMLLLLSLKKATLELNLSGFLNAMPSGQGSLHRGR